MNILLVAINAKYSHTNLAVRDLQNMLAAEGMEAGIAEYTINQSTREILSDLARRGADTYCFSCYIWNIEYVRKLGADLRLLFPEASILLGGPEVSFDPEERLAAMPWADAILCGEGEPQIAGVLREGRTRCPFPTAISTRSKTGCSTMSRRAGARSGAATACRPPTGRCVTARCRASSTICGGSSTPG